MRRIDQRRNVFARTETDRRASAEPERASHGADEIRALFGVLQQEVEKEKPNLEPTRRAGIEDFMERLGEVVASGTREGTLDEMLAGRGKLDALTREIQAQGRKPSLKGPGAPAGSRSEKILAAIQELKMFVWSAGMQQGMAAGMRAAAIDLFPRIGRLTTWISQAGSDAAKVRQLESDQARGLANEVRLFARRAHVMLARPVWPRHDGLVDANRIFFSGPARIRSAVAAAAAALGLETDHPSRAGAEFADHRWQDLRAANVAVFDLSDADPQVYYELGIALAVGSQLLLVAQEGTNVPFDVAQSVRLYGRTADPRAFAADELDGALYGLQVRGGKPASLAHTLAYAERLAAADKANPLSGVALKSVRNAGDDPVRFLDALNAFNGYLGASSHDILLTRWPGRYPEPLVPRCFSVLPYREAQLQAYAAVEAAARQAGVEPVRGDVAEGQQIIESIWDEICRATHVTVDLTDFNLNVCLELGLAHALGRPTRLIAREGTERELRTRLPGAAKWRCHAYGTDSRPGRELHAVLDQFFAKTETT
jgi:nucleoside 2-deoxyribosyltransferase